MSIDRANSVGNIGNFYTNPSLHLRSKRQYFPYHILKGYCFVSEILLTPQMAGTKQEDGTTLRLQRYRTAAVVGYIMYMRVASPHYAEASCFGLHEGTILNRTTIKTISVILLDNKKQTAVDID